MRRAQAIQRQREHFQIGLAPRVAVDFGAELQRLARGVRALGPGVQHRAAVAKPRDRLAPQQVRIDARHLRRGVGANAERAARQLVDQLESLEVERFTGTGEQRVEVLDQGRDHQLVAIGTGGIEQFATEFFDAPGLRGQYIGDVIRQEPGGHGMEVRGAVKNVILPAPQRGPIKCRRGQRKLSNSKSPNTTLIKP